MEKIQRKKKKKKRDPHGAHASKAVEGGGGRSRLAFTNIRKINKQILKKEKERRKEILLPL